LALPHRLPGPPVVRHGFEFVESMLSLSIALPTLEVASVRARVSRTFGTGILGGSLKRNRRYQPDVIVCVLTEGHEMVLVANPAPGFVVEERRVLAVVRRLRRVCPCSPLTRRREQLYAAL